MTESSPFSSGTADALGVAAVAQLAVELVDEVAPVGEDQHPARLRRLHESQRRDGLAGAGRVLEPEALGGVGILGLLGERLLLVVVLDPVARLLLGVALLLGLLLGLVLLGVSSTLVLEVVLVLILIGGRALDRPEILVVLVVLVLLLGPSSSSSSSSARLGLRDVPAGEASASFAGHDVLWTEDVGGGEQLGRGGDRGAAVAVRRRAAPRPAAR